MGCQSVSDDCQQTLGSFGQKGALKSSSCRRFISTPRRQIGYLNKRNCTNGQTNDAKSYFSLNWNIDRYLLKLLRCFCHAYGFFWSIFLNIRGWTKGKAAIEKSCQLPESWGNCSSHCYLLLPLCISIAFDCLHFSPAKKGGVIIYGRIKADKGDSQSHFTLSFWECVCVRGGAGGVAVCLEHLKVPPFLYLHSKITVWLRHSEMGTNAFLSTSWLTHLSLQR